MSADGQELLAALEGVRLVDHHAHGILRETPTLDEFRGLFSESRDPRQWPHLATCLTYRRAIRELAAFLGCEPTEQAVYERRIATDPAEYASSLLRATRTEWLLVDDGYPPRRRLGGADHQDERASPARPSATTGRHVGMSTDPPLGEATTWDELGELAACEARPVMRIERVGEETPDGLHEVVGSARANGFVALNTVAAYRGGLDRIAPAVQAALEANEATSAPLPVQIHTGFGDADLFLARADPAHLKPLVERFPATPFVLLHCYPFVREAGWLAHV